jgi:Predicted phosphatases
MRYRNLCFDMDGTLLKTDRGIVTAMKYAADIMGIEDEIPYDRPELYIGPSVQDFCIDVMGWDQATTDRFNELMVEKSQEVQATMSEPYGGIIELLQETKKAGMRNFICTAKAENNALCLAEHFGLLPHIESIAGAHLAGDGKTLILRQLIEAQNLAVEETVMIGDRYTDLEGGVANGTHTVGVLFGYGSHDELHPLKPAAICETVADLRAFLLS